MYSYHPLLQEDNLKFFILSTVIYLGGGNWHNKELEFEFQELVCLLGPVYPLVGTKQFL